MCSTCGCGKSDDEVKIELLEAGAGFTPVNHSTGYKPALSMLHDHHHEHGNHMSESALNVDIHGTPENEINEKARNKKETTIISIEEDILARNKMTAERNRSFLEAGNIIGLNLVSSPGSGKTTLLEKTLVTLKKKYPVSVIEGDQRTNMDAERIQATGVKVVQINTGQGCHLDAEMVHKAITKLLPERDSFLFIENVGNLVCPSLFDLGEAKRVVIISVTEGEDKPLKYPNMFATSQLCIINKTDLLPYVDFNMARAREYALRINHDLEFIEMSAKTGEGLSHWINWLAGLTGGAGRTRFTS